MIASGGLTAAGKSQASAAGATAPRSEGPSRMPESTSPMTGGCPRARTARPKTRPETTTTASASRTRTARLSVNALQPILPRPLGLAHAQVEPQQPAAGDQQVDADHAGKDRLDIRNLPVRDEDHGGAGGDQRPADHAAPMRGAGMRVER